MHINIEGKQKNLQNRKFCLRCSPYGAHNTSKHDPVKRVKRKYGEYTEKQKDDIKSLLYRKALQRKIELIKLNGGACKCGYNKCIRALEFHHKDPKVKLFGLSLNNLWSKSWEEILAESQKCELLCSNCHRELEYAISLKNLAWYNLLIKEELLESGGAVRI